MKKYFCDVCGAELAAGGNAPPSPAAELCGLEDLCTGCEGFARELDAAALVLVELRRLAQRRETPAPPSAPPPSVPLPLPPLKGRYAKEKQDILTALEVYRKASGPGSIPSLARRAGVEEEAVRGMILRESVPIDVWRAVGKALEGLAP